MTLDTLTKALNLLDKHKESSSLSPEQVAHIGSLFIDAYKKEGEKK